MSGFPRVHRPCAECPFRADVTPGMFPVERYDALACTAGGRGREAPLGAPMFACHKSPEGAERACAGWLATCGVEHIGVRLALVTGRLPAAALEPGEGWPALHPDYATVAAVQGATS